MKTSIIQLIASSDPIAVWAAVLSTILALIKIWEIWKTRIRIEVSYSFMGIPEEGNQVIIRNLSPTPIIITYWDLQWRKRKLFIKPTFTIGPNEFNEDIKISGHTSHKLIFRDQDHFDWGPSSLGKNKIYLLLHIAGKKWPSLKKVYG